MAWALKFTGTEDGIKILGLSGLVSYEITLSHDMGGSGGGNYGRYLFDGRSDGDGYSGYIYNQGASNVSEIQVNGIPSTHVDVFNAVAGDVISFQANTSITGSSVTIGAKGVGGDSLAFAGISKIEIIDSLETRILDATASDHSNTGVQPVLLDTVGGNNATGVGFPTDGSAWVDLGGDELLAIDSGSYSLSGNAIGLIHDSKIIAGSGTYSLTGAQTNLIAARKIIADSGSYDLTGTDVVLVYTPGGDGEVLSIDSGAFSLSGSDIGLKAARLVSLNNGSYNLAGQPVTLTYNAKTIIDSGGYALTGSNVNIFANRVIIAQNGSYNLTGSTVTLRYSGEITQVIGTVSTSFANDKYSANYKPNSITVNFKG